MTLKTNRLKKSDFEEFIKLYKPDDIKKRKATFVEGQESKGEGRWRSYSYDEIIARDKTNLDIFWLKDDSLEDTENLPAPEVLAAEIVEQLEAALEEFRSVEEALAITGD
jgi:type I restriction enzyme M protein